jgi:urease accessory protein
MTTQTHQRAKGRVLVRFKSRDGITVIDDLRQEGCLKARFPRPVDFTEAVLLNSSGGVAGGDRLSAEIAVGEGASACISAQAAERFYRALAEPSYVRNSLRVEAGATAEWLPQESILFDRSALDRRLDIDLAADGRFLGVEMLVFGRAAMGESVRDVQLADTITIRRDGRLIWHDALRFVGDPSAALSRAAVGQGAIAVASLLYAGADAAMRRDDLRAVLTGFEAGVSLVGDLLVARIVAADGEILRAAVVQALACLRDGRDLPRVWRC